MKTANFQGTLVALITPFTEDGVDYSSLKKLVQYCLDQDVDAFVACGTTGEAPVLTEEEFTRVLDSVMEVNKEKVPIIAGCGTNSTSTTIAKALQAQKMGIDGLLIVTPYYNKPNQESLHAHYLEIVHAVNIPIILYNVPSRTGVDLLPETVLTLAKHSQIVGIKEATGSLKRACELINSAPPGFSILSGDDFTALPFTLVGGHGVISVVANVVPGRMSAMIRLALSGNKEPAQKINNELYPLIEALFEDTNPVPVKMALKHMGFGNGVPRLPLLPLNNERTERLYKLLCQLKLVS